VLRRVRACLHIYIYTLREMFLRGNMIFVAVKNMHDIRHHADLHIHIYITGNVSGWTMIFVAVKNMHDIRHHADRRTHTYIHGVQVRVDDLHCCKENAFYIHTYINTYMAGVQG
jgi:hypothetical protein